MGENPSTFKVSRNPVETVFWTNAVEFCNRLSKSEGVEYRLPTEAEWECACRAGTSTTYSFGDDASKVGQYMWYTYNSDLTTHPVGQKLPNAWGLYDMHGNVWEWCQDWYGHYGSENVLIDPTGSASGKYRVLRGGSFAHRPKDVRSANRHSLQPDNRGDGIGFRLARTYDLSP